MSGDLRERLTALADEWERAGMAPLYESPVEMAQILRALLAETEPVALRGVEFIKSLVGAWDCCGTCAGGVLVRHDADVARAAGERIARAIEARRLTCYADELGESARNALSIAAVIARTTGESS